MPRTNLPDDAERCAAAYREGRTAPMQSRNGSSPACGGGVKRSETEGASGALSMAPPPFFAWSPSPALRGRNQSAPASSRNRQIIAIAAALLMALPLAGCGKKGSPQPPPDEPNTFPRSYPNV